MKRSTMVVATGVAVALVAGAGLASAHAAPGRRTGQPANPHPRRAAASVQDTSAEAVFTPVVPCRIADTRRGGGSVARNTTRGFQVTGDTGFGAQGGTVGGCGVPQSATAVAVAQTVVDETGSGYLTVYPSGASRPATTSVSFTRATRATGSADLSIGTNGQIDVYNGSSGSTDVVLDVTGYFIGPIRAEVDSTGKLLRGSRAVSATRLRTGSYEVDFDRDVSGCAYVATSYFFGTSMQVEPRLDDVDGVYVAAAATDGAAADSRFYLTVTC